MPVYYYTTCSYPICKPEDVVGCAAAQSDHTRSMKWRHMKQAIIEINDTPTQRQASIGWVVALKAAVVTCASRSINSQARRQCTTPSACPTSHPSWECMPASAVLQQLICCNLCVAAALPKLKCTLPIVVHVGSIQIPTSRIWRHTLQEQGAGIVSPPQKEVPKGHMCAPCNHQDAINKTKERYGANPPHLATTVAGCKYLSV